jgi:sigma-E factor negative regulatory protein RseA
MKERISALMDGELDDKAAAELIETLGRDRDARLTWASYHMISDAMREGRMLSDGFGVRLSERLAAEPTVVAPRTRVRSFQPESKRWYALSAAASLAAVALVGWLAFAPQPNTPAPVAQAPAEAKPNIVPLPTAANDYLLAHQGFSPRVRLQGMAPYVRTVSEQAVEPRR